MPKRSKRLKKGIGSLEEQIKIHEKKRDKAREEGNKEREEYYNKEIAVFESVKDKKEDQLDKS